MTVRLSALFLLTTSMWAAEFHSGQAARLVLGQPSFSARDAGIVASSLLISNGQLYATDTAHRLLIFDLAKLLGPKDELMTVQGPACTACGFSPASLPNQPILQGSPAVSIYGTTVVLADAPNHRVLIWRDTSKSATNQMPDVVLARSNPDISLINGSTLIEPTSV